MRGFPTVTGLFNLNLNYAPWLSMVDIIFCFDLLIYFVMIKVICNIFI